MEDLLARERAAEQHTLQLLKSGNAAPITDLVLAVNTYRPLCESVVLADFRNAELKEMRLWQAHTETKTSLHRALSLVRKSDASQPVHERQVTKLYLDFIKQSMRFYREYLYKLSVHFKGIPEFDEIAHRLKAEGAGESQPLTVPAELRTEALASCHRTLIFLGDLSRYRVSDKLDKHPDFGPALGFYDLAAHLLPSSGMGHHQLAVIALAQQNHLRAIYHLYRAMAVQSPHPHAPGNLEKEFGKINAAWDKGQLIQKGQPNDPEGPKNALVGWFVRFHSMCYKGTVFRGHEELEREVLSQLSNVVKQRSLENMLLRVVLVNIAAEHQAGERFQANPNDESRQSFLSFFRFNIKTFTTLLQVFNDDLRSMLVNMDTQDIELAAKVTPIGRRLLPFLRVYNNWLLLNIHMMDGLSHEDFVKASVLEFWPSYAQTVDLIAQAFPIWDLEDLPEGNYMLKEDDDTFKFKPLDDDQDEQKQVARKTWYTKPNGTPKPKWSSQNVVCLSTDDEMLRRVGDFLADGLYLANDVEQAPIKLLGTRLFVGDPNKIQAPVVRQIEYIPEPIAPPKKQEAKPVSYAAAAANGHARQVRPAVGSRNTSSKGQSRDAQLSRMVDDLVDEEEAIHPVTPPQRIAADPAIVSNGDAATPAQHGVPDVVDSHAMYAPYVRATAGKMVSAYPTTAVTPPAARGTPKAGRPLGRHDQRLQSVWDGGASAAMSSFPSNLPTGTLGSPAMVTGRGHSRVNSASSIRSRNSLNMIDSWGTTEAAPRAISDATPSVVLRGGNSSLDQTGMASPLLFGAGESLWSTSPRLELRGASPPFGHGG